MNSINPPLHDTDIKRSGFHRLRLVFVVGSWVLCVFVFLCYGTRSDSCAAITFFPVWTWAVPGLVLAGFGMRHLRRRFLAATVAIWLLFLGFFADEPRSLARGLLSSWPSPEFESLWEEGFGVRVVSLNCGSGGVASVAGSLRYEPDVLLLQESTSQKKLETLIHEHASDRLSVLWGVDASIVTRGEVVEQQSHGRFMQARVHLASGREVVVMSLHLSAPSTRIDLWSSAAWREQTGHRRRQRTELAKVVGAIDDQHQATPVILGGDFNAPPGDAIFQDLKPHLHDTFSEAGIGLGNTLLNDLPVLRIDQIWASRHFRTTAAVARKTEHSDHRLMICDLVLPTPDGERSP